MVPHLYLFWNHGMCKTPDYAAKSKVKCCKINHYCQWQIPHFVTEWIGCVDLGEVVHEYQWCILKFFGELKMFGMMVFNKWSDEEYLLCVVVLIIVLSLNAVHPPYKWTLKWWQYNAFCNILLLTWSDNQLSYAFHNFRIGTNGVPL